MTAVEVITSVERRRCWSREEKLRIIAESAQPGRTVSQVARDHGIAPNQLFTWRRRLRAEAIAGNIGGERFVPVQVGGGQPAGTTARLAPGGQCAIEIRLPNGIVIGVSEAVAIEPLRRVLAALAGG